MVDQNSSFSFTQWVRTIGPATERVNRNGDFCLSRYYKAVPIEALRLAAKIDARFPEAEFYVTDYADPKPDPFLRVIYGKSDHIIAHWDEPGFYNKVH